MEWISVEDRLPEPFESVLCYMPGETPFPTVHEGYLASDGIWVSNWFKIEPGGVTYWAEMPKPPIQAMYNNVNMNEIIIRSQLNEQSDTDR